MSALPKFNIMNETTVIIISNKSDSTEAIVSKPIDFLQMEGTSAKLYSMLNN